MRAKVMAEKFFNAPLDNLKKETVTPSWTNHGDRRYVFADGSSVTDRGIAGRVAHYPDGLPIHSLSSTAGAVKEHPWDSDIYEELDQLDGKEDPNPSM